MKEQDQVQHETEKEPDWVELSADMICAMVAHGDPKFRKQDQARQKAVAK